MERPEENQPVAPDWEVLFSHHLPSRYGRTLALRIRGRRIHFCTRCTGEVVGLVAFLLLYVGRGELPIELSGPGTQLLFAIAPAPAAADWLTQALGRRESNNALRAVSGTLLGLAITDALWLGLTERWLLLLGAALVASAYLATLLAVLVFTGAWRQVLEEHFPGSLVAKPPPESFPP